ncbi:hypothetical protein PAESOLCIP111_06243 [Paenibacillus solanacearum]|uniref:Uncharacterized protein n=1 Tax=Paenibacillus solanacearum TaxID=2048548 RepID=A0A916NLX8_9BACL|nr:hypothetical protein [Paenibacillus solanacearum]CAG7651085.1 hypothetical protein PAESOLCIP111_06243 [Paenibacillus solanacearum]
MVKRNQIVYRNERYGFTLRFPGWWRNYCVVSRAKLDRETEYEVHFRFKYRGQVYEDILALLIYRMTRKEWIDRGYEESPLGYLAEFDGRIIAYSAPEELPYAFVDSKTGDYNYKKYGAVIELLKRMVNQDVPRIVQTLQAPRKTVTMRSTPFRSRKVVPCRARRKR